MGRCPPLFTGQRHWGWSCRNVWTQNPNTMVASHIGHIDIVGRMAIFVLSEFSFSVLMGTTLGFLSGLGTGGGSLLILWLAFGAGMPQAEARLINLMYFIPSAVIASLFRWKQGTLEIKKVLPAMIAGSTSAVLFSIWSNSLNTSLLEKLFGGLLIFTGIREFMYKPPIK